MCVCLFMSLFLFVFICVCVSVTWSPESKWEINLILFSFFLGKTILNHMMNAPKWEKFRTTTLLYGIHECVVHTACFWYNNVAIEWECLYIVYTVESLHFNCKFIVCVFVFRTLWYPLKCSCFANGFIGFMFKNHLHA